MAHASGGQHVRWAGDDEVDEISPQASSDYHRVQSEASAPMGSRLSRYSSEHLHFIAARLETDFKEGHVSLEHDCYSISLLSGIPDWAAAGLPILSAIAQFILLYFTAFANDENMFDEGHWLQPKSSHGNVRIMKVIGVFIALFKVSTEVQHAQALFRALSVGDLTHLRRLIGYFAFMLQYFMAVAVLAIVVSVVMAGPSCTFIMAKIFSTFVIVDMDNLMARFLEVIWRLDFHIKVDPELSTTWRTRERLVGGMSVRLLFLVFPAFIIIVEVTFSLLYNTPLHTVAMHGYVSNDGAPQMLMHLIDGCCPPMNIPLSGATAEATGTPVSNAYNYSIMFLAPLGSPPPVVHWIAIEAGSEPRRASSLQILEGRDGDGNWALQKGQAPSRRVQAGAYLQEHGFDLKVYHDLSHRKSLYRRWVPYEAIFVVAGLRSYGSAYRIYVVAQNPLTLALASSPVASPTLVTSVCAQSCETCEMSGSGRCDRCAAGTHRTSQGLCLPCPEHCVLCAQSAALFGYGGSDRSLRLPGSNWQRMPCDVGGCAEGYGLLENGVCKRCAVTGCVSCDGDAGVCQQCKKGHGVGANGTCQPCRHDKCICMNAGACDLCETGWGFTINGTCAACREGCAMCEFARNGLCESCRPGFGFDSRGSRCQRCLPHCMSCNASGPGSCDYCQSGFGFDSGLRRCVRCTPDHCLECDGVVPYKCARCMHGFGVTHEGQCELCGTQCKRCDAVGRCKECHASYTVVDGVCEICGDRCMNCSAAGPGRCDACYPGFVIEPATSTCLPHGAL